MNKIDFTTLADKWPSAWVARTAIPTFTGGMISEKYIANLDCQGRGPVGRVRIGRKIAYPVMSVVLWLETRSAPVQGRQPE